MRPRTPKTFQGIIFDFNGVLWWDEHLQRRAWQRTARKLRGVPLQQAEIRRNILGTPNRAGLEYLVGHPLNDVEAEQLTQEKEAYYRQLCLAEGRDFKLSPGAVELLDFLAAKGIPRTISTASEAGNLRFFIQHLHLEKWFDVAKIVYDDGTFPGKPHPEIYRRAAANLNLAPADCVVVEDSISGIEAAQAAGIGLIYAMDPGQAQPALSNLPGVFAVIGNLSELPRDQF